MTHKAVTNTACKHLVGKLKVLRLLLFGDHHVVNCSHESRDRVILVLVPVSDASSPAYVLYRFTSKFGTFKRNYLIGYIYNDLVIDVVVISLCAVQDGLFAFHIVLQEQDLPAVL